MQDSMRPGRWVVYAVPVKDDPAGRPAVCSEKEWDRLTAARPGVFALIRDGMASEGEAERFARGAAGDRPTWTGRPPGGLVRVDASGKPSLRTG